MFKRIWKWLLSLFARRPAALPPPSADHPEWALRAIIRETDPKHGYVYKLTYEHRVTGATKPRTIRSLSPLSPEALIRYAKIRT